MFPSVRILYEPTRPRRLLIDALEKSLRKTSGESLCETLYKGLLVNQTKCLGCETASERQENYYDILLQVNGSSDLVSSLREYTTAELLAGVNKYQCASCPTKQDAHRSVVLRKLPPILTFSCQRFDIDRTTWQRVKITSSFEVPLVLDMSRFLASGEGVAQPRLDMQREAEYLQTLRKSAVWLDDLQEQAMELSRELISMHGHAFQLRDLRPEEMGAVRRRLLQPNAAAGDDSNMQELYQLSAVIMHRGTAYSGHYFAYIRDWQQEGVW